MRQNSTGFEVAHVEYFSFVSHIAEKSDISVGFFKITFKGLNENMMESQYLNLVPRAYCLSGSGEGGRRQILLS